MKFNYTPTMRDGIAVGLLLILGLAKAAIGLPLILAYLLLTTRNVALNYKDLTLFLLIVTKVVWLCAVYLLNNNTPFLPFAVRVSGDIVLLTAVLIRKEEKFFHGLAIPVFGLLLVDAAFNGWAVVFGSDPFGRQIVARPDDYLPRMGGVFYHPFYSINISVMAMLFAFYLRRKFLFAVSIANVLVNGSYRGVLTLVAFAATYVLVKRRTRFPLLFGSILVAVLAVFLGTIYSVPLWLGQSSGNYFRVVAWVTSLEEITKSPITGCHSFEAGEFPGVSETALTDYGIAESSYLDYALHYGVLPALLHFAILLIALDKSVRALYGPRLTGSHRYNFVVAIFASMAFIDSFYGTLVGGMLTSMCFGLLVFSRQRAPTARIARVSGALAPSSFR